MNHQNLWAPWRMAYLRDLERQAGDLGPHTDQAAGSFFADYWAHPELDEANHVIRRTEHGMILLNRYPYANGHLLVALAEPRPTLLDYDPPQRAAFWQLIELATDLMQRTLQPQGINTGINQGKAAGAGVPEHLHAHLVPRWAGDTNFMSVVGRVRVIPDALGAMAAEYRRVSGL
ncbi:MAG TPA: HIT domain-containing protein [Phycisphaerales bacterium]|nr:HIT domain-containing protein [Phycisphaerales bacterium]